MLDKDTYRHKGLRNQMIEALRADGITDENVLKTMNKIPRHFFIESIFEDSMYKDIAFQIGAEQTISKPSTVAFQTQLLELKKGEKVLEIGTGSGYQTSVLCDLGAKVYSIERHRSLHTSAKWMLDQLGYRAQLTFGDGYEGLPHFAPFDKIIVTCGAANFPEKLIEQLKVGGIMVIPVGEKVQTMYVLRKLSEHDIKQEEYGDCQFVPMLSKKVSV